MQEHRQLLTWIRIVTFYFGINGHPFGIKHIMQSINGINGITGINGINGRPMVLCAGIN